MIPALSGEFKTSRKISNRQLKIPEISLDSDIFMGLATFEDIDRKFNKFASFSTSKASFSKKLLEAQEAAPLFHQNSTLKSKDSFSLGKVTFKLPSASGSSFKHTSCERKNSVSTTSNADTISAEGKLHTPRNFSDSVHRVLFKETKLDQQDSNVLKESSSAAGASASVKTIRLQKSFSISGQTPRMSLFELTNIQRSIQQNKNISAIRSGLEQMNNESITSSTFSNPTLDSLSTFIYEFANTTIGQINVQSPPNVDRILMALGIQRSKFISLPTSKEKEKWIISSIQRNCKEQLDQLLQKISARTQYSLEQEEKEMNKCSNKRDIGEIFSWIKIPSKYEALKKKLQQNLVEILYSEGNAERLQAKNEEFNNNSSSNALRRDSSSLSPSKIAKKKRNVQLQFEDSVNNKPLTHFKKRKIIPSSSNFGANTERYAPESNQLLTGFAAESEKMLSKKLNEFNWNNNYERTFQSYKKYAQGTFIGYDSMNRWQTIGMQPIIQMLGLEEKLDLYREQLLRQFREEGQQMKESEIMFLINTSELLDSNIDKVQFQSMLDFISEDDIQRLELCIAENILKKYVTVTEQLKSIRNTFLTLKSNKTAKNNEKNALKGNAIDALKAEQARKAKQRMWKGQIERIKKMLVNKAPQISYFLQLRSNPYVQHFAQQLKKSIASKDFRKLPMKQKETHLETFAKRNYPAKTSKPLFSYRQGQDDVKITLKDSLKICHPTSRIILGLGELQKAEELKIRGDMKSLSDLQIKQVKDLELQKKENYKYVNRMLNQSSREGKRDQFLEYYSSGPSRKVYEEQIDLKKTEKDASGAVEVVLEEKEQDEQAKMTCLNMNQKRRRDIFEDKEVETQAVIVIQKWTRMLLEQKIFKNAIAKKREIQEKKMFEILKKWKESKDLIVFLRDQSRKIQYAKQQSLLRAKSRVSSSNYVISPTNRGGLSPSNKGSSLSNKDYEQGENENPQMIKCIQNGQNNELEKGTGVLALSKFVETQYVNESQQLNKERSNSISSFQSKASSKGRRKVEEGLALFKKNIKTNSNLQKKQKQQNNDESLITTTGSHTRSGSQIISNAVLQSPRISDNFSKYSQNDSDQHLQHSPQKQEDNSKDLSHQVVNPHLLLSSGKFPWASAGSQSKTAKIVNMRDKTKQHEEMLIKQRKLLAAAKQGSLQIIKSSGFVYYASDFDAADDQGKCALFYTITRGLDDFTQFLIKGGANVNFRCSEGNTPLHAAFKLGRSSIIVSLVDAGGDLNRLNDNGFTPLGFGSPGLLHELGLDAGVNQVRLDTKDLKASYKFNNNQLFKEKHDTVDGNTNNNVVKEQNSPYTLLKKRKERRVDEEIPEEQTFYQYLPANTMADRVNYDKNYGGVQILRENSLGHRQIPFVQSFVEPTKRNQSGSSRNYQK